MSLLFQGEVERLEIPDVHNTFIITSTAKYSEKQVACM